MAAKILRCRDVGVDCDFEARGATEEEILQKCSEHGRTAHGIQELTPNCSCWCLARSARNQRGKP